MTRLLKWAGIVMLWIVILFCLVATIAPRFLDRVYYRGPVSAHFDGERFFNPDGEDAFGSPGGGSRSGALIRYLTGGDERPVWPAKIEVAQARPPVRVEGQRMLVTWVGHATMLVQTQGMNILTDPIWSDVAGPMDIGPKRVAVPGIAMRDLPPIDVILISHDHYDHMDLATLKTLWRRDHPTIVTSLGNDSVIAQAGVKATALDWGQRTAIRPGIDVVVNRSHHWGSRWFTDRNRALWSSFVVTLPGGNLFFAGDTGAGDLKWADRAASYGPIRLALIPIGAFRFAPGEMASGSHIGPVDAVEVYRRLGSSRAIGVHWGTFHLSYEGYRTPPRLLAAAMKCTGRGGEFDTIAIGQPTEIAPYTPPTPGRAPTRDALLSCLDTPSVKALR